MSGCTRLGRSGIAAVASAVARAERPLQRHDPALDRSPRCPAARSSAAARYRRTSAADPRVAISQFRNISSSTNRAIRFFSESRALTTRPDSPRNIDGRPRHQLARDILDHLRRNHPRHPTDGSTVPTQDESRPQISARCPRRTLGMTRSRRRDDPSRRSESAVVWRSDDRIRVRPRCRRRSRPTERAGQAGRPGGRRGPGTRSRHLSPCAPVRWSPAKADPRRPAASWSQAPRGPQPPRLPRPRRPNAYARPKA